MATWQSLNFVFVFKAGERADGESVPVKERSSSKAGPSSSKKPGPSSSKKAGPKSSKDDKVKSRDDKVKSKAAISSDDSDDDNDAKKSRSNDVKDSVEKNGKSDGEEEVFKIAPVNFR